MFMATASASGEGVGMQQSVCSNSWLPDSLEVCMERWEQKREERRKRSNIWAEVMSLSPLKPQFWGANQVSMNTPGKGGWKPGHGLVEPRECSSCSTSSPEREEDRGDTGWAQPNLALCVWSACERPWRDGWELLANSKSKKKMEMRMGMGRHYTNSRIQGGSGEERLRIEGWKTRTFAVLLPTRLKIWKLVFLWLFEFSWFFFLLFLLFSPSHICKCSCQRGEKWRKNASQKVENRKRSQAREPR